MGECGMMIVKGIILALLLSVAAFSDLTLWYDEAASKFEEALPIGNGRLVAWYMET